MSDLLKPTYHKVRSAVVGKKEVVKKHYYAFMPDKKHHRVMIWVIFLSISIVLAIQILYPIDRALPLSRIGNEPVGFVQENYLAAKITEQFDKTKLLLTIDDDHKKEVFLKQLGADPNTQAMINKLTEYPLWQRFIPGSILWVSDDVKNVDVHFTSRILLDQLKIFVDEFSLEPQDANLAIENSKIIVKEAASGNKLDSNKIYNTITSSLLNLGSRTTISVPYKEIKAARLTTDISPIYNQATQIIGHDIKITAGDRTFVPSRDEVTTWVTIREDETGALVLGVDNEKVSAYVDNINKEITIEPGTSNVTIVDGHETGRTSAASGRAIDTSALVVQLADVILSKNQAIVLAAPFVNIPPKIIYNNKYSASEDGLRVYINDLANSKNVRISLIQLDGNKWTASARVAESIPAASTFKLFVALVLFDKMNKGEIHWDDAMLDTTVSGCFDRMTIASTNPCAVEWINQFGRQYINDFIHVRGFSDGTNFLDSEAVHTTAADLTKFMVGLQDGSLVSGANRDRLLNSLSIHPYKYGIQTGSQGKAYDKVGFLWDYIHNTAIVIHPRGTYVVTIMTKGYSYATIANITRELERIMYP